MDQQKQEIYIIDTSSLVAINELPDGIEEVWQFVINLITVERIKTAPTVLDELPRVDEDALNRVKPYSNIITIRDTPELLLEAGRITHLYPNMCRPLSKWNLADPYVVALAKIHKYSLITNEGQKRRKMHKVCSKEGINSLTLAKFIAKEMGH